MTPDEFNALEKSLEERISKSGDAELVTCYVEYKAAVDTVLDEIAKNLDSAIYKIEKMERLPDPNLN